MHLDHGQTNKTFRKSEKTTAQNSAGLLSGSSKLSDPPWLHEQLHIPATTQDKTKPLWTNDKWWNDMKCNNLDGLSLTCHQGGNTCEGKRVGYLTLNLQCQISHQIIMSFGKCFSACFYICFLWVTEITLRENFVPGVQHSEVVASVVPRF